MSKPCLYAAVLAGGGGTRLWPASRRARPKQLLKLGGQESLLEATVRRITPVFGLENILVVTARDQEAAVRSVLRDLPPANIIAEPAPRNTAGAIQLGASLATLRSGPSSVLAVLPADQHIGDEAAFRSRLRVALRHATDAIVTIGIQPTGPETGFGYIRVGAVVADTGGAVREVAGFVEKPNRETAIRYLETGEYLWNAGMFFLTAERMAAETERSLPHLHALGRRLAALPSETAFKKTVDRHYATVEAISIDYGVMEKAQGLLVVPGNFGWNDVGSWSAIGELAKPSRNHDEKGNVLLGDVMVLDGEKNIVVSDPGAPFVGTVGVSGLIVVATADGVLVIPRDRAQDVRHIVDALRAAGRIELLENVPKPVMVAEAAHGKKPTSRRRTARTSPGRNQGNRRPASGRKA
jgi:mannose-1-phosphate guanylyltransferase